MRVSAAGMPTAISSSSALARAVALGHRQMGADRLDDLVADAQQRIERGQRVLEDRADLAPADRAHARRRQIVDALPGEPDLAAGDAAGRLEQADHGRSGQRLAGAGLADDAQNLAGADRQRHAVDRLEPAVARVERDFEVAHLEHGRRHGARLIDRIGGGEDLLDRRVAEGALRILRRPGGRTAPARAPRRRPRSVPGMTPSSITKRPSMITVRKVPAAAGDHHGLDRVDHLPEVGRGQVEHRDVGLGAGREAAEIVAPQRLRAAERRGVVVVLAAHRLGRRRRSRAPGSARSACSGSCRAAPCRCRARC